jgi:hypothetical protein
MGVLSKVEILNFSKSVNSMDVCEINGQVINSGETAIDYVELRVVIYNGNQILESDVEFIIININLEPGQTAGFNIWFEGIENWNEVTQTKYELIWGRGSQEKSTSGYL